VCDDAVVWRGRVCLFVKGGETLTFISGGWPLWCVLKTASSEQCAREQSQYVVFL